MRCKLHSVKRKIHPTPTFFPNHTHPFYELVYWDQSEGEITIDGRLRPFSSGCFSVTRAGVPHDERNTTMCRSYNVRFDMEADKIDLRDGIWRDGDKRIYSLITNIHKENFSDDADAAELMKEALLTQLIIAVYRIQNESAAGKDRLDISEIENYIEENYYSDIDFQSLAREHGYSYNRFRHIFKQETGLPPYAYLKSKRVDMAKYMIRNSDKRLSEIAYDCGFGSQARFSEIFRAITGMTPLQYKRSLSRR